MPDADDAPPLLADAADGPSSLPAAAPGDEADAIDVIRAMARLAVAFGLSSNSMVSGFLFVGGLAKAATLFFWFWMSSYSLSRHFSSM